jgi:predicted nucleic acid-binding protein
MRAIADTGFIVALWSKTPARRQWARSWFAKATLPFLTSSANLQEAGWLLKNHLYPIQMVLDGDLDIALDMQEEANVLHGLIAKYSGRMDLADASIVRLSELNPHAKVLTVDNSDFKIYRRFGRENIPCDFPPGW